MKLDAIPQNPIEWLILRSGMVPTPLGHGHIGFLLSRALLDAVDLGIFDALKDKPLTLEELAEKCDLKAFALRSLMNVLAASGYIKFKNNKFDLTDVSRKWLLKDKKNSVYDLMLLNGRVCWSWMDDYKEYLKTGKIIDYHERLTDEEWGYYQRAMAASARVQAVELLRRTPVKKGSTRMLDIGGSHGIFSLELCKKYDMTSEIMELPEAINSAENILKDEEGADRISYIAGNVLTSDLGEEKYDLVLISNLTHHFTRDQNIELVKKVKKALTPGGHYVIMDFVRPKTKTNADLIGMANDMFFSFTSNGGTYSISEMKEWLEEGELQHLKTIKFLTIPGTVQVAGKK